MAKGRCMAGADQPCPVMPIGVGSGDPCECCEHWKEEMPEKKPNNLEVPLERNSISLAGAKVQTDTEFLRDIAKRVANLPACYSIGGAYDIRRLLDLANKLEDE